MKNVEEFTDHSHRETKQEHIDPRPSCRRKEEILLRKVGHSKASERRQRLEAVSNFSYNGSICMPPCTQNYHLFAGDTAALDYQWKEILSQDEKVLKF